MKKPLPIIAFTIAYGEAARKEAAACVSTFRRWHPDVPILCFDEAMVQLICGGLRPAWSGEIVSLRSLVGWFLSRQVERVICLDTDLFVLGRLDALLDPNVSTALTKDNPDFTMGVPQCPVLNNGVLASSNEKIWQNWTRAQFSCLLPAVTNYYFDQLSLRLILQSGSIDFLLVDGQAGRPFYNISIREFPGEWRVEGEQVFKGEERALIYHQAGEPVRGVAAAPRPIQALLADLIRQGSALGQGGVSVLDLWAQDGKEFCAELKHHIPHWPTLTLDQVLFRAYSRTPDLFRTAAPLFWDRFRRMDDLPWRRLWKADWNAFIYKKKRPQSEAAPLTEAFEFGRISCS